MNIFVIQIYTQSEEKFIAHTMNALKSEGFYETEKDKLFWPRRTLVRTKKGIKKTKTDALYPGYLFYISPSVSTEIYKLYRRIPGFVRFLKDNQHIEPLSAEDESIICHFRSFGEIAETSKVYFDEQNKIQILAGPMKGLEGKIVKVDKRKRRAKVVLNLYKESFPIDLGFEILAPLEEDHEADKE